MPRYTEAERLEFARASRSTTPNITIHPSVGLHGTAVIGYDGFGWVRDEKGDLIAMPHMAGINIEKNVTIRAYVTIDRGVSRDTAIHEGTRIDHHCHIAHGAKIGKHNTLANGCIIEGSCEVGDYNTFGAGVIVQTKVKIGNNNTFGSGAVVVKDVGDNEVWAGCPAAAIDIKSKFDKFPITWTPDEEFAKYILGFVDGEAYFSKCKHGNLIGFRFGIEVSAKDKELLYQIKEFFGVGVVRDRRRKSLVNKLDVHHYCYDVSNSDDINHRIIPFFDNHILKGFKKVQYKRWREEYLIYRQRKGAWGSKNPMQLPINQ